MDKELIEIIKGMDEKLNKMNVKLNQLDSISNRLENIEKVVGVTGFQFEELTKHRLEAENKLEKEVAHLRHKVSDIEKDVYLLKPQQ